MVAHRRRQDLVERPEQSLHQIRFGTIRRNRRQIGALETSQLNSTIQSNIIYNSPLSNFTNLIEPNDSLILLYQI